MSTQNLYVNGSGQYTAWDLPVTSHYLEVDETSQDGDTSYIADNGIFAPNGSGPKDSFNIDAWTHGNKLITKVEVIFWAKKSGGAGNTCRPLLYLSPYVTEGTQETLGNSYVEYTQELSRPGGGNWNYTDLADLEVGVIANASEANKLGDNIRVTQVYAKITYTEDFATITSDSEVCSPYPRTFYLSKLTSDLNAGGDFNVKLLEIVDEAESYHDAVVLAGDIEGVYAFTEPNVPYDSSWPAGSLQVKVDFALGSDDLYVSVSGSRVDASGDVQETTAATAEQEIITSGVWTFDIPSYSWAAGNVGDRLRINYRIRNDELGGGATVRFLTGKADSNVGHSLDLHGIGTINSDAEIETAVPSLDFTGLTIAEVLKLIDDNDSEISINRNKDALATMLQKIATTNNINIDGLAPAEIIQKFDIYYS